MTDEQAKNMILRALHNAGVEVVTDKQVMESVLGESLRDKTAAAALKSRSSPMPRASASRTSIWCRFPLRTPKVRTS